MKLEEQIAQFLEQLAEKSSVARDEAIVALPALRPHGAETVLGWLDSARRLVNYSRDAGIAFIRGTPSAESASETVAVWTDQALKFLQWPASPAALEGFMKNLPGAFDALGHAGEQRWSEIGFNWYGRHADSGRAFFTTPVLDLAGRQGITGIEQLCASLDELYESRKLLLATCLSGAIRVRNLLGLAAVSPWATHGADLMQLGKMRGEAYFKLESEESLAILLEFVPGFKTSESRRLLALLLYLWFEREFELKESTWSPEKGRPFVETDGRNVLLPAVIAQREEAILGVLHAAGRMLFGSFDQTAIEAIFQLADLELPDDGAIAWAPLYQQYGSNVLGFRLWFDACEGLRIDCQLQRRIPNHLARVAKAAAQPSQLPPAARCYYQSALDMVETALAVGAGITPGADPRLQQLLAPQATIADAFRIANELYCESTLEPVTDLETFQAAYLPGRSPSPVRTAQASTGNKPSQPDGRPSNPGDSGIGDRDQGQEQSSDSEQRQESTARERVVSAEERGATDGQRSNQPQQPAPQAEGSSNKGKPYPEWDYREGRYKRNWSWVQEKPLAETNLAEADRLSTQYANVLKRLKKAIQAQKPTRLAPKVRQFEGDDFDLNAAVSYVAEYKAGMSPPPAIYRRREVRQRDVSVSLLADMSTSVMQHLPDGGGRLIDRVRAGVLLFAESMEEVGDAYSVAGFCSKYRDNVNYYTIKEFDEPLSPRIVSMIGGMSGRLATRMGAAIRHATARFSAVSSKRRLLLILSDGRPEDYDDGGDRRYLHEDTRMAVKEAVARGVHPFCVTVDTMANQYLPQIFGRGHYLVLDQIDSLPNKLPEIYLKLRR